MGKTREEQGNKSHIEIGKDKGRIEKNITHIHIGKDKGRTEKQKPY